MYTSQHWLGVGDHEGNALTVAAKVSDGTIPTLTIAQESKPFGCDYSSIYLSVQLTGMNFDQLMALQSSLLDASTVIHAMAVKAEHADGE